jgi:hypothetical protein
MSAAGQPDGAEEPRPPSKRAQAVMAAHLSGQHGVEKFSLEQHVYMAGERQPTQVLEWNPAMASFFCGHCRTIVVTGELTPQMMRRAQLFDEGLKPNLVGLNTQEERDEMTRHYLSGRLNTERLRRMRGAASRRAAAQTRPAVADRRRRVQTWMLQQYARLGVVERVLDAAAELQRTDPDRWQRMSSRPLARETLRTYWQDIDPATRAEALQRDARRRSRRS